jgi:hypothetical protein
VCGRIILRTSPSRSSPKFKVRVRCKKAVSLRIDEDDLRVKNAKQPYREVKHMNGHKGIYVGGTLISILISLALYLTGRRESAIFVGLWAPTILNLGQSLMEED